MPRPEKVRAVEEIRERLTSARATFVTEYRGLSVAEQQALRKAIREAAGDYKVVKMSLARRAADAEGLTDLEGLLTGPTALAFAETDPVPVAKALRDFAKEHDHLVIKGALLANALLPPEQVSRLADIESREVLLAKIAGAFEAPLVKLAGLVQALPRNAASMFSQLLEKKEEAGEADAAVEETTAPAEEAAAAEEAPEEAAADETPEAAADDAEAAPAADDTNDAPEASAEEAEED